MSIHYLEAIAVAALALLVLPWFLRCAFWLVEVIEAAHRRRHAARRRARVRGYLPIHDEEYKP